MKKLSLFFVLLTFGLHAQTPQEKITIVLNNWHFAAANAKFDEYMSAMTNDAIYIGTDATENWNKKDFMTFAKPYFDRGKAWSFTALERHVYISKDQKTAWFDELLDTQMKICRGSGILIKVGKDWKIQHYVLSMTIPNDNTSEAIKAKTTIEDQLIEKLKKS
jgi:SnoaL-like domain